MVRKPAVSGQFYPANKLELMTELDEMISSSTKKVDAIGAISPHAGYVYSGKTAGELYGKIAPKDTYVVLSPNHTGYGASFAASNETWHTPLGDIEIDNDLLTEIIAKTRLVKNDPTAHLFEHSIEVQLPFIQRINPLAKIVPITVKYGSLKELDEVASAIASSIKTKKTNTMIIASSDMTHYESRESACKKDKMAIAKVLELDAEGLMATVEKNDISMCGYVPSTIMLMCAKKLGAKKAELVKYTDSGEATGDTNQVVGYAAVVVY